MLEENRCCACGSGEKTVTLDLGFLKDLPQGIKLVSCRDCKMEYVSPCLSKEETENIYSKEYFDNGYIVYERRRIEWFKNYFAKLKEYLPLKDYPASILDIGSGCGYFLKVSAQFQYPCLGVELSDFGRKYCQDKWGLPVFKDISGLPKTLKYDMITFWDSLGHIINLKECMDYCSCMLKDNGYLVIKLPNFKCLWYKSLFVIGKLKKKNTFRVPTVIWRFSKKSIKRFLEKYGFEIVELLTLEHTIADNRMDKRMKLIRKVTSLWDNLTNNRQEVIVFARKKSS